ncbi:hypothetical protein BH11BAC1_BH11BAC1_23130 [soil metagenome]
MTDSKPKIYFFSPFCILRTSTNRIFDMRMCDAFASSGSKVTLVFPYLYLKENLRFAEIFRAYGSKNKFELRMQHSPLTLKTPHLLRTLILLFAFLISTLRIIFGNIGDLKHIVIISRETIPLVPILLLKKIFGKLIPTRVALQIHEVKKGRLHRWVYANCSGLMPNVPLAKEILSQRENIPMEKMVVMNAPMLDFTSTDCSKKEAREKIKYETEKPLVVYTGKVGKGIAELDYILEAAILLPQYNFIFTGGKNPVVKYFQEVCLTQGIKNVTFTGFFSDTTFVRYYQLAADVLVSYYNFKDHLVDFNYPQKIQEYLSTGNPIVTPDFSATREVISEMNAFIVEPDNSWSLAQGIREAVENKALAKSKSNAAFEDSKKITYDFRIVEFLEFFERIK